MEEELKKKLLESLGKIIKALESGTDFVGDQAPLVVKELLTYHLFYYTVWIFVVAVFGVGLAWLFFSTAGKYAKANPKDLDNIVPFYLLGSFFATISTFCLVHDILAVGKIHFAPRLFVIEYLKGLM